MINLLLELLNLLILIAHRLEFEFFILSGYHFVFSINLGWEYVVWPLFNAKMTISSRFELSNGK